MNSVHPLDRDDSDDEGESEYSSPQPGYVVQPEKRLLKLSAWAIVFFGVLVALSSVAVNNTSYGSSEYQIARAINLGIALLLLLSFAGVLLAYQLPRFRSLSSRMFLSSSQSRDGSRSVLLATSPISLLTATSLAVIVLAWLTAFLIAFAMPFASFILSVVTGILPGLLIAMIVWNKGCVRAYAIGALASFVLSTFGMFQIVLMFARPGMNPNPWSNSGSSTSVATMLGLQWTMVVIGGLIPAWYVWLLSELRHKRKTVPAEKQHASH
jgi:hypothetical protein